MYEDAFPALAVLELTATSANRQTGNHPGPSRQVGQQPCRPSICMRLCSQPALLPLSTSLFLDLSRTLPTATKFGPASWDRQWLSACRSRQGSFDWGGRALTICKCFKINAPAHSTGPIFSGTFSYPEPLDRDRSF